MTVDKKIRYEKLQHNFKLEAAKVSTWSSDKIDKYEYLTGAYYLMFRNNSSLHILL